MVGYLKKYMVCTVLLSLAFMPASLVAATKNTQKSSYSKSHKKVVKKTIRKSSRYKHSRKTKRQRQLAYKKQRAEDLGEYYDGSTTPRFSSGKALLVNQETGEIKYAKNSQDVSPIASITKLMTAMVILDAKQPFDEPIRIRNDDIDTIKNSTSRLAVGTTLSRAEMFQLALMASENRAAYALSRNYPGGRDGFVEAMNAKAAALGLKNTQFVEPTGLMYQNTSTAEDLYKLVAAAYQYPDIRNATTTPSNHVYVHGRKKPILYKNTNNFVRDGALEIGLSKTGFIDESGRCLVMQTVMAGEPVIAIFLDAEGVNKRTGDVNRARKWLEYQQRHQDQRKKTLVAKKRVVQPKLTMSHRIYQN